jgi:uncharacterized protein
MTRRELLAAWAAAGAVSLSAFKGDRTMEQRISIVTLGVKDLARSRQFYVDGLGWEPAFEHEEIVFFQTGGIVFALFLRDQLAADFNGDAKDFGKSAMALGYNVRSQDEVDPLMARAAAAGATILKRARKASWGGYSGYFADPDGFAWEVAWNPAWPVALDGTVTFR